MTLLDAAPQVLSKGKTAWNLWTGVTKTWGLLRNRGAKGIVVQSYILDGALFSAMTRHLRSFHAKAYDPKAKLLEEKPEDSKAELMDWDLYLRCASHGLQLSIVWALKPVGGSNLATQKLAHLAVKALRTSSTEVHRLQGQFMAQHVHYREVDEAPGDVSTFWGLLRVPVSLWMVLLEVDPR